MNRKPARERSEPKSARTRARILDAAAHVLSVKGYAATRLTDVAEYAELQAPAIYYYFASREDLLEEVMWAGIADMVQHVSSVLMRDAPEATPMARILVAVDAHLRHELDISDYTTAAIRNYGQVPDKIRARQRIEQEKYNAMWRELFTEAVDHGEIRPELNRGVARKLVMGALNWAAEWWDPERGNLDEVVQTAQSIVLHGLSPADRLPAH